MKNNYSGQTLIEVLVALAAAVIILTTITVLVLQSLNQAVSSKNMTRASHFAQEGMEVAKSQTLTSGSTYCVGQDNSFVAGSCSQANIGIFKREVSVAATGCGGTLKKVTVSVSWTDSECKSAFCHTVPVTSCL